VLEPGWKLAGVPAGHALSKQARCHREVLVPELSSGMKVQTETRIYAAIVSGST
jgi:hypothetical protein